MLGVVIGEGEGVFLLEGLQRVACEVLVGVEGIEQGVKGLVGARPAMVRPIMAPGSSRL